MPTDSLQPWVCTSRWYNFVCWWGDSRSLRHPASQWLRQPLKIECQLRSVQSFLVSQSSPRIPLWSPHNSIEKPINVRGWNTLVVTAWRDTPWGPWVSWQLSSIGLEYSIWCSESRVSYLVHLQVYLKAWWCAYSDLLCLFQAEGYTWVCTMNKCVCVHGGNTHLRQLKVA